jgi:choline kinase
MTGGGVTGVILAAGKGARLNGGHDTPKCLVSLAGETLLARNVRLLHQAGIGDVVVVVGCAADAVRRSCPQANFVHNPIYGRTNSLYSLWLARTHLTGGMVVMNCDVLIDPQLLSDLLTAKYDDALLVDHGDEHTTYGDEEMKVRVRRGRVIDISKSMACDDADGENVGVGKFSADGARVLIQEMDALVKAGELQAWAPRAFARFAIRRPLHVVATRGLPWIEIDFPEDYVRARDVVLPQIEGAGRVCAGVNEPRIARTA